MTADQQPASAAAILLNTRSRAMRTRNQRRRHRAAEQSFQRSRRPEPQAGKEIR